MKAISPVFDDTLEREIVLGKGQPEYEPLPVVPGAFPEKRLTCRYELTHEERAAIAAGADVMITVLTFGRRFTPILPWIAMRGGVLESEVGREITGVR